MLESVPKRGGSTAASFVQVPGMHCLANCDNLADSFNLVWYFSWSNGKQTDVRIPLTIHYIATAELFSQMKRVNCHSRETACNTTYIQRFWTCVHVLYVRRND